MPTIDKAPPSVYAIAEDLVAQYHQEHLAGAKFDFLLVYATRNKEGVAKGSALKNQYGVAVESITKVNNPASRALGHADVEIKIDGDVWKDADDDYRNGIIDAALERLEISVDEEGRPEVDDHGRPKLKLRAPDVFVALYWGAVERNPTCSELAAAKTLVADLERKHYLEEGRDTGVGGEDDAVAEDPESGE